MRCDLGKVFDLKMNDKFYICSQLAKALIEFSN